MKYGYLTIEAIEGSIAICRCDCGNVKRINRFVVQSGRTKSCGCKKRAMLRERNTTHGMYGTPEYRAWHGARSRCYVKSNSKYEQYGGRGISMSSEWKSFEQFLSDMGPKPSPEHSLDRIDVNGNYEKANCRWATREEQAYNKTTSRFITVDGKTQTLAAWAKFTGIDRRKIADRINRGWSPERALELE